MSVEDPTMQRITGAIALLHAGRREEAVRLFSRLWSEIERGGDALHRCTLAHFMADVAEGPHEELAWDLRALAAADDLTDERVKAHHASMSLRGLYPSLHLNVAEDYRALGDLGRARAHLRRAQEAVDALADGGYGRAVRGAIARLEDRIAATLRSS